MYIVHYYLFFTMRKHFISTDSSKIEALKKNALTVRRNIIEMLVPNESHHIGCSLSIVDILVVLYFDILAIDSHHADDRKRDIFILSKGHAGAALYATLAERGFFDKKILQSYDRNGGMLSEHVTTAVPGVELSTGSLGHGLPAGVGHALAARNDGIDRIIYVLISDGDLNEGSNWEAFMFAAHHFLSNLVVIVDSNKMQGYGEVKEVIDLEPVTKKLASFGWNTYEVDGHNHGELIAVFEKVKKNPVQKPHFILAHTIKGKGIPFFEGKFESHYKSIDASVQKEILRTL